MSKLSRAIEAADLYLSSGNLSAAEKKRFEKIRSQLIDARQKQQNEIIKRSVSENIAESVIGALDTIYQTVKSIPVYDEQLKLLSEQIASNLEASQKAVEATTNAFIDRTNELVQQKQLPDILQVKVENPITEVKITNLPKPQEFPKEVKISNQVAFPEKIKTEEVVASRVEVDRDNGGRIRRTISYYADKTLTTIVNRDSSGRITEVQNLYS